jgi:hypothetical protein
LNILTLDDLIYYCLGSFLAHIVNNDISAESRKHQSVRAAKPTTSASDDDGLTVEADLGRSLSV